MDAEQGIHTDKCRLCLRRLSKSDDIFFEITEITEHRLRKLTSLQLISSQLLSSHICAFCDENLAKYDAFREDLIKKQAVIDRLYNEAQGIVVHDTEFDSIIEFSIEEPLAVEALEEYSELMIPDQQIEPDNEASVMFNSASSTDEAKILSRPKAWHWTEAMEADLVRYFKRYKTDKTTGSYAFGKISKKFETKGYPNISPKSIKYKFEKLVRDSAKLSSIEQRVMEAEESDEDAFYQDEAVTKRKQIYSCKTQWTESMEVALLFLNLLVKKEQPAISDNNLYRIVSNHFQKAGFGHIQEHNICYHLRKLKRENPERLLYLEKKARELREPFPGNNLIQLDFEPTTNKRKYLHWTEDMKQALLEYREGIGRGFPSNLVWPTVANQLESDGYGTFTPESVMHKYYNLKRQKLSQSTNNN